MASLSRSTPAADAPRKDAAERASRIAAMLARWSAEDVAEEPEWSIDDIEPMLLRQGPIPKNVEREARARYRGARPDLPPA